LTRTPHPTLSSHTLPKQLTHSLHHPDRTYPSHLYHCLPHAAHHHTLSCPTHARRTHLHARRTHLHVRRTHLHVRCTHLHVQDDRMCLTVTHRVWVEPNPSSPRPTHDHIYHPANSRSHGTHTRPTITVGTGRACLTTRSFGWSPTHPSLPSFLPTLRTSRTRCC